MSTSPWPRFKVIWKVFSVVCYVVSGLMFACACLLAFAEFSVVESPGASKPVLLGWLFTPAFIALGIGLAFTRFRKWRRDVGIVFASAAGYAAVMALTVISVYNSQKFREFFPDIEADLFSDYASGIGLTAVFAIAGFLLIRDSKRRAKEAAGLERQQERLETGH